MLNDLLGNLKSEVGNQIMSQTNLPEGKLDSVFSVLGDVTQKEVTSQMAGGGISNVMNLFSHKQNNENANNLQSRITSGVISNLVSRTGLSGDMAGKVAQIAVPALIGLITKKNSSTSDDDPSPLNDIFGGGKATLEGAKGMLGKFLK
ncbi:MAG TPA: hypothetical protein VK213_01605 [Bacteroidales bacterium]|nr:hypothetical protein [Bacteroidales bacterium]